MMHIPWRLVAARWVRMGVEGGTKRCKVGTKATRWDSLRFAKDDLGMAIQSAREWSKTLDISCEKGDNLLLSKR